MSTQVQFRRGTTTQNNAFTGAIGEISVDTDLKTIRLHDGTTAGGGATMLNNISSQTALNKTFSTGSAWQGNAVGLAYGGTGSSLTATAGAVAYSTSGGLALSAAGTSGQILTSGGTGAPTWVAASSISAGTSTLAATATNIAGGSAGQLIIQADTGLSTFITAGASGTFLKSAGAGYAPTWATANVTIGSTVIDLGSSSSTIAGLTSIAISGTADATTGTNGALTIAGGASIVKSLAVGSVLYVGTNASTSPLTAPAGVFKAGGSTYAQLAMTNSNSAGSSDLVAYADNGSDTAGWADMGITGSNFSDSNYTITGNNDGYFFVQPVGGSGLNGNLVLATGGNSAVGDIILGTGGFLAANEKWRFISSTGALQMKTPTITTTTGTTGSIFNSVVTTLNVGSAATTVRLGGTSGTLTLGNPTIVGTQTTQNLWNTIATTVNAFGAATTLNLGNAAGTTLLSGNLTVTGNITIQGTTTTVTSTNSSYSDSILELHSTDGGVLTSDDGKDVGLRMHYFKGSDKNAALVLGNDSNQMEFYVDGTETSGVFSGTYGYYKSKGFNHQDIATRDSFSFTTSGSSAQTVFSFPKATYTSGEFTVQVKNGSAYKIMKFLVVHDGTTATMSSNYLTDSELQTATTNTAFSVTISGSNVLLQATVSSGTAVIKGVPTLFTA
jgi:hypothetical protein